MAPNVFAAACCLLLTATVHASPRYVCTGGGETRLVNIVYETTESSVPCRVDYTKQNETQTLWQAQLELGYCEDKAQAFLEKLAQWGFSCQEESGATH